MRWLTRGSSRRCRSFTACRNLPWPRIAQSATTLALPAGRTFVRQYDRATAAFLLSGSVQILMRVGSDDLLVGVLREKGELIGWSMFRPPYRYTASVRCEGSTVVLRVPATIFEELFAKDPAFAYATLSRVALSVANRYESARDLLRFPELVSGSA
jgi:CRP-like cAMP-binding protein